MNQIAAFLGYVSQVTGSKVKVNVSSTIPSASPILGGRLYKIGQMGSFVKIPLGFLNLYGIITTVGAVEANSDEPGVELYRVKGQRWLEVQLVGEAYGSQGFNRGVSTFPTIDDEVHLVTQDDLRTIYATEAAGAFQIGSHAVSEDMPALMDLDKLVTRHAAIVGSTGSGKSNTVACLMNAIDAFTNSSMIVIDPHGEYGSAFEGRAKVFRIGDPANPLFIPYWALTFDELAWFLVERKSSTESPQDSHLRTQILERKQRAAETLKSGAIPPHEVTADAPIPFDIRDLWFRLHWNEHVTFGESARTNPAYADDPDARGDAARLMPAKFLAPGPGSSAPFRPVNPGVPMLGYVNKLYGRLRDRRFSFLLEPGPYDGTTQDLGDLLRMWLDHEHRTTIFDLSGVPFDVMDMAIGAIARIIYSGMFWGRNVPGVGRKRPTLLFLEEAHNYLPRSDNQFIQGYARKSIQRIFKEGRKYGVGAVVVSQRPSELDETVLSQCGSFIALRLSNSGDQGQVKSTIPDSLGSLMDLLPSLRNGEAIVVGEAVTIPSRIRFRLMDPRPDSQDPDVSDMWTSSRVPGVDFNTIATCWRRQKPADPSHKDEGR